ncbi:MAG TPA: hypothetical protein VGC42_20580 [Kofleriaceae bacterium]
MIACRSALVLVALAGVARADAPPDPTSDPTIDPTVDPAFDAAVDHRLRERLTRLAERHYAAGEYYRAISAYEELAVFGDAAMARFAAIRIAMSYHHGHQLDDAVAAYRRALALAGEPGTAQALRIQLALARAERSLDQPGADALDAITAELAPSAATGSQRARALGELARLDGLAGHRDAARRAAAALATACLTPAPGCDLAPRLAAALAAPPAARRAPWLGLAMSLVVPGAGSVYGGRPVDGIYGFALTTLSGLGAWDVYDGHRRLADQRAAFFALAALGAVFYTGGALQGYVAVARHNQLAELDARRALWDATATPLPLDTTPPAP